MLATYEGVESTLGGDHGQVARVLGHVRRFLGRGLGFELAAAPDHLLAKLKERPPQSMLDVIDTYTQLLAEADKRWSDVRKKNKDAKALPDAAWEAIRQVLYSGDSPCTFDDATGIAMFNRKVREARRKLERQVEAHTVGSAFAPPRAMVLRDRAKPHEPVVFIRGSRGSRE